jgi:hypothetical protein
MVARGARGGRTLLSAMKAFDHESILEAFAGHRSFFDQEKTIGRTKARSGRREHIFVDAKSKK